MVNKQRYSRPAEMSTVEAYVIKDLPKNVCFIKCTINFATIFTISPHLIFLIYNLPHPDISQAYALCSLYKIKRLFLQYDCAKLLVVITYRRHPVVSYLMDLYYSSMRLSETNG